MTRRDLLAASAALGAGLAVRNLGAAEVEPGADAMLGPIVGHTDAAQSVIWMRIPEAGDYALEATAVGSDAKPLRITTASLESNDYCLHWHLPALQAATTYRYRILKDDREIAAASDQRFTTAPAADVPTKIKFAISSCAREDRESRDVWKRMAAEEVDAVILIGDTPYIDSTELAVQTRRHREFAAVPEYQALLRSRPCWWTWDDHDFAGNDADGQAAGKENSRLVFTRYRPQTSYGDGEEGIYTSFRFGPVEVFMIDARWFSRTEPSFADPAKSTLLGARQWNWLKSGLTASTAPFKLLACGMIWDDKESHETDDWGTYYYERRALEKLLAAERIPGVVLVGGDIHASRVLRYKTKKSIGYELVQFIASPIHSSVIPSLNVYHPDLVRSAVEPNVFLLMEIDTTSQPAMLTGSLVNRHGSRVFSYDLTTRDLSSQDDAGANQ